MHLNQSLCRGQLSERWGLRSAPVCISEDISVGLGALWCRGGGRSTRWAAGGHTSPALSALSKSFSVPQVGVWRQCQMTVTLGPTRRAISQGQGHCGAFSLLCILMPHATSTTSAPCVGHQVCLIKVKAMRVSSTSTLGIEAEAVLGHMASTYATLLWLAAPGHLRPIRFNPPDPPTCQSEADDQTATAQGPMCAQPVRHQVQFHGKPCKSSSGHLCQLGKRAGEPTAALHPHACVHRRFSMCISFANACASYAECPGLQSQSTCVSPKCRSAEWKGGR